MKKIILFIFCMIFLVGIVSAADWDNALTYEEDDMKVTISNTFLLLFKTSGIGTIELKSHSSVDEVKQVSVGNQIVMWYDFNFRDLYEDGIGKITFENVRIGEYFNKDYKLVYWGEKEIDVYGPGNCKTILLNGTQINCEEVVIGTTNIYDWLPYNSRDIPKGNIRIGVVVDVKSRERTDVIWTIAGKEVSKHAEFTGNGEFANDIEGAITDDADYNMTLKALTDGIVTTFRMGSGSATPTTSQISVYQSGVELAQGSITYSYDTSIALSTLTLGLDNYSSSIRSGIDGGVFKIWFLRTAGDPQYKDTMGPQFNGTYFEYPSQDMPGKHAAVGPSPLFTFNETIEPNITLTLNFPIDAFNSSSKTINFNGSVSSLQGITNVSLYLDGVLNETNASGINDTNYLFTKTNLEGSHNWTYGSCNVYGCHLATNRTFTIDLTDPILNITFPLSITYNDGYIINSTRLVFINFTATDTNLDACWYSTDEGSTNTTITCGDNATIGLAYGTHDIKVYGNDTAGNIGSDSETPNFEFRILQNNLTYNNETIEGVLETFNLDFNVSTSAFQVSTLTLVYNGVSNAGSFTKSDLNYNGTESIVIPQVGADANLTFYWSILLADSNVYNSSSFNQSVKNLVMDDCGSLSELIFNYTLLEEETQVNLTTISNTTMELSIFLFDQSRTSSLLNFSKLYNNTNPAQVCINVNLTDTTKYSIDSVVKYSAGNYEIEYYNIINFLMQNLTIPQNINLYDLLTADSTEFKITFKDESFQGVEGALIHIQRQYIIENNTFKLVELPKTDSNGQTLGHFVEKDIVYNILVTNGTGGAVLGVFNNIIAFCSDAAIGDCEINLNAFSSGESVFDYEANLQVGITAPIYNSTSRLLSLSFITFDGSTKNVTMHTFKYDQLGNTTACDNSLTSSSGTLSCTIPTGLGNSSIQIYIYVDGDLVIQEHKSLDETSFGEEGYLFLLFLILTLVMIFSESKTAMIIAPIIGFIIGLVLSVVKGSIIGMGASMLFLIIAAIILIWKLNKSKP